VAAAVVAVLYSFAPEKHAFYPRCVFYSVTGLQCPGCGGLRAAHRLLHGEIAAAWKFNPLAVSLIPLLTLWSLVFVLNREAARSSLRMFRNRFVLWGIVAGATLFTILRNF
jgi:hypothetical protein